MLLLDNDGKVTIGNPLVEGAYVAAKILGNVKGDKVIVFKKRRRKGYRKLNGHRQYFTQIFIQGIAAKGETIKLAEAPIVKKKGREEVDAIVTKQAEVKKATAKKPAKKAAAKKPAKKAAAKKKAE